MGNMFKSNAYLLSAIIGLYVGVTAGAIGGALCLIDGHQWGKATVCFIGGTVLYWIFQNAGYRIEKRHRRQTMLNRFKGMSAARIYYELWENPSLNVEFGRVFTSRDPYFVDKNR